MRALDGLVHNAVRVPCTCHAIVNATQFALTFAGPLWTYVFEEVKYTVNYFARHGDVHEKVVQHSSNPKKKKVRLLYLNRFTG